MDKVVVYDPKRDSSKGTGALDRWQVQCQWWEMVKIYEMLWALSTSISIFPEFSSSYCIFHHIVCPGILLQKSSSSQPQVEIAIWFRTIQYYSNGWNSLLYVVSSTTIIHSGEKTVILATTGNEKVNILMMLTAIASGMKKRLFSLQDKRSSLQECRDIMVGWTANWWANHDAIGHWLDVDKWLVKLGWDSFGSHISDDWVFAAVSPSFITPFPLNRGCDQPCWPTLSSSIHLLFMSFLTVEQLCRPPCPFSLPSTTKPHKGSTKGTDRRQKRPRTQTMTIFLASELNLNHSDGCGNHPLVDARRWSGPPNVAWNKPFEAKLHEGLESGTKTYDKAGNTCAPSKSNLSHMVARAWGSLSEELTKYSVVVWGQVSESFSPENIVHPARETLKA